VFNIRRHIWWSLKQFVAILRGECRFLMMNDGADDGGRKQSLLGALRNDKHNLLPQNLACLSLLLSINPCLQDLINSRFKC